VKYVSIPSLQIQTIDGPATMLGAATVRGCEGLAAHLAFEPSDYAPPWSVSHVASGYRLAGAVTRQRALEAVEAMAALGPELDEMVALLVAKMPRGGPVLPSMIPPRLHATLRAATAIRHAAERVDVAVRRAS